MAKRLGERLVEAGLLASEAIERALAHQRDTGLKLGECLVALRLIDEGLLLRFLATEFRTRFVSTEKLSKAKVPPEVLARLPESLAQTRCVFPLSYDAERRVLSVVMAEPQNEEAVQEIALITNAKDVFAYVGTKSAVLAAIAKHYRRQNDAFTKLEQAETDARRNDLLDLAAAFEASTQVRLPAAPRPRVVGPETPESMGASDPDRTQPRFSATQVRELLGSMRSVVGENDFVETLNVFVGLLEMLNRDFRGHSASVARQAALVAQRLSLEPREIVELTMAAYLHDLGKGFAPHYTLLSTTTDVKVRESASRQVKVPIRLFETVHLPHFVNFTLAQVYEAFDGTGVPAGSRGDEIGPGARILAACDALFELTRNPNNALGRVLTRPEALDYMAQFSGTLFDPAVLDALKATLGSDGLRQRLENDGRRVWVADPDDISRSALVAALTRAGLSVQQTTRLDGLLEPLLRGEIDMACLGLTAGALEIVKFVQVVRARPESAALPLLIIGQPEERQTKSRLSAVEIDVFIPVPVEPDQAVARIRGLLAERIESGGAGHPVHGAFDELPAGELARLLGKGRKWGRLAVRVGPQEGVAHIEHGRAVFAHWGALDGEPALKALLQLPQAEFLFDPEAVLLEYPNMDKDLEVAAREPATA